MKHGLYLVGQLTLNFDIVTVSPDSLLAFLTTKMSHVWTASKNLTGAGNFKTFHNDLSRLLLDLFHCLYFFGFIWAISSLPINLGLSTIVDISASLSKA